ncbi:hypothetical protein N9772_01685 [Bacteroidia bacterium]|nr:hypothetical protein [Bacteroidia bacterium]
MDNLQHIDDLLRQASQVPANALVTASDWTIVDKRLKRRKNRIYAMWFFLALVSVSSLGVFFYIDSQEIYNTPILAKTTESLPKQDTHKTTQNFQVPNNADLSHSHESTNELTIRQSDYTTEEQISAEITMTDTHDATRTPSIITQPALYIPAETITLLPTRNTGSYVGDISPNTLQLIPPTRIASVIANHTNTSESTPKPERHWEVGVSFTPGLSNKITSESRTLNGLINRSYYDKIANSETTAFSNTFGFNIQYHAKEWFISSGLFITKRREQLDYKYTITEGPLYDATTIYSYVPLDPIAYESIVYSGSNSYHFIEIPLNIGHKTTISPNFELRTQLGASYMALRNREGKKGNFTTLELEDLQDLQFAQHNIAANVKTGLYLNKSRFIVGVEPTFGINLNSLRSVETSAIKTKPYGYGLNITSAIKLFKL